MRNTFTMYDIKNMERSFRNATIGHDCLPIFLNCYDWESIYETEDDSLVFSAGGKDRIEIEFFNFNHALKRTASIMYWENGKPVILELARKGGL